MMKTCKTALVAMGFLLLSPSVMGGAVLAQSTLQKAKANDQFKPKPKPVPQTNPVDPLNRINPAVNFKAQQATNAHQAICKQHQPRLNDRWYPSFDWSTPARYGHDRKLYKNDAGKPIGNGIIDLPNTREYINNTVSYSNNPGDACPCSGSKCIPRFRINLEAGGRPASYAQSASAIRSARAKDSCDALDFPDTPKPTYRWRVNGTPTATDGQNGAAICLPEGYHDITVDMTYDVLGETQARSVTRKIEVIDHLIVNIGDSYGAGEGVPEKNFWPEKMGNKDDGVLEPLDPLKHFAQQRPFLDQWADPGTLIPRSLPIIQPNTQETDNRLYAYSGMDKVKRQADRKTIEFYRSNWDQRTHRSDLTGWEPDWPTISDAHTSTYRMLMNHQAAHRSSAAAASQLALHLESHDNKSSVTFLNLAASGATIDKGLLGRYNGVQDIKSLSNPTKYRPRDRRGNTGLEPQVEELEYLLGARSADSVYLSVGGNDVGFANIIAVFLTAFDGDSKHMDSTIPTMLNAFENGKWSSTSFGGMAELGGAYASFDDTIGLNKLRDGYVRLNTALSKLNISGDINLIGYPNFSSSTRNDTHDWTDDPLVKSSTDGTNYCNLHVKSASDPHLDVNLDFDPIEFKVADEQVLTPLYEEMVEAVDHINRKRGALTWNFIDQGVAPSQHGICGWGPYKNTQYMHTYGDGAYSFQRTHNGDMTKPADILTDDAADADHYKWYRTPQDGAAIQLGFTTTNKGMFHPNEFGYRHAAREMMKALTPYGAELDMPSRMASLHHNAKGEDRFSDPNDSIREATETVGLKAGDVRGTLKGLSDVKMFKVKVTAQRCSPITIRLNPSHKLTAPLTLRVYGRNGALISASDRQTPGRLLNVGLQGRVEPLNGLTTIQPHLKSVGALSVNSSKAAPENPNSCRPSDQLNIPGSKQTEMGAEVSFIKDYHSHIYVAVSHAQNRQFDPITGRGDIRADVPIEAVSFTLSVEKN